MAELKPCPFCGGKAVAQTNHTFNCQTGDFSLVTHEVKCRRCLVSTWGHYDTEKEAITAWNTRTKESEVD